jgi:AraC family transcriptional regulator of adaptative response/methylated-DNA-[protein]-cysteine methyltransferase
MMTLPSNTEMYRALVERDQSFDGLFFACVRTTGIFCRPTCHARKPKPENVEYAPTIQEALHRGYRPCLLCEPMSGAAAPNWLAPLLEEITHHPDLRLRDHDLRVRGLDPVQVRRTFKRNFGMTFQAYQRACRLGTAMKALHGGAATIDAGLDAGFESDSGFRDAFARVFGETPGRARATALLTATWIESPLGPLLAIAGDEGLELLEFVDRRALETELRELRRTLGAAIMPGDHPILRRTAQQLGEYFAGTRREFDLPLKQRGSAFQLAAWRALCEIPFAETRSYSEMARRIGSPGAVRAIGRVNGQNQIAIVVPCHRVIRADGSLCGYGGGRWRKQWLLDLEQRSVRRE